MENPLTVKNILNEDIQEKENEFRFLFSYKKQNCKTRIIIFSLVLILFLLIILLIFTSKIFSNSDKNNTNTTNEQNTKNEIEMKYIPEIGKNFPFSLIINDYGKISTDDNCFEDISPDKIKYEKEAFFSYDKKNIEQNSQISNSDNIGISIIGDKIPFLSDFIFKAKIDSVYQKSINNTNIIVKSQISSLSIKRKDIKFDDSFLNKIKKIGLDESYNDKEKALELNKIFKNYGFFIPLKIYFGGYFYQEVDKIEYQENRKFLMSLKSNVSINFDNKSLNGTFDNSISYKSFFNNLFSHERINIIGGDITKHTLDEWKDSLNYKNSKIVGYENLIPITDLLNDILDYDISKKLSKPFNLINEKYELRRKYYDYLIQAKGHKKKEDISREDDYIVGISEQNKLIYSEKFKHTENKKFEKNFDDIIVGLKIIDNWKDKTNGKFFLNNPLLKNYILIKFDNKFGRRISFDIEIFFLKNPDKITIN